MIFIQCSHKSVEFIFFINKVLFNLYIKRIKEKKCVEVGNYHKSNAKLTEYQKRWKLQKTFKSVKSSEEVIKNSNTKANYEMLDRL